MRILALTAAAAVVLTMASAARASGTASDGPGNAASWATGNKVALGTSAATTSKVWFTAAKGITSEVFYPRADVPNMQDMQYVVTAFNGNAINSADDLTAAVFHAKSGQTVTVTIRRHGATKRLSMTLGVQPTSPSS